jgi:hypothetical protein
LTEGCSICKHSHRDAIEQDLCAEPIAWGALGRKYGVHHLALMRHKREHMKPAPYDSVVSRGLHETLNKPSTRVDGIEKPSALARINISRVFDAPAMASAEADGCLCYWCGMSGYQRLLRAWAEANTQEKERFCADTRTMDVPF